MTGDVSITKGELKLAKDPRQFIAALPKPAVPYVRYVGLDLASSCGVGICDVVGGCRNFTICGAQWDLSLSRYDTQSLRYLRLLSFLDAVAPNMICYEEVKFTAATPAPGKKISAIVARSVSGSDVVKGLAANLVTWAEQRSIPCEAVPIGTLKRYATGKGSAGKVDMINACNATFGTDLVAADYEKTGADNVADAIFLCSYGVEKYET